MKWVLRLMLVVAALSVQTDLAFSQIQPSMVVGTSLPFQIFDAHLYSMKDGQDGAAITVSVRGGTSNDWAATAVEIAKAIKPYSGDGIILIERNNPFGYGAPIQYKSLARLYLEHGAMILLQVATHAADDHILAIENAQNEGVRSDEDEVVVWKKLRKRFGLSRQWRLPPGNLDDSWRPDPNAVSSLAKDQDSLSRLTQLLRFGH